MSPADQLSSGPLGEGLRTHPGEHLMGLGEVPTGVDATIDPTQPFPVTQVGTCKVDDHTGALEAFDGFGEKDVRMLIIGDQCSSTRQETQAEVGSAGARAFFQTPRGHGRRLQLATPHRGFDQFGQSPPVHAEILVFTSFAGGGECFFVPAEPVVQHGGGPSDHAQRPAFTPGGSTRCRFLEDRSTSAGIPRKVANDSEWYRIGAR
jgi:hypothetical protein